MTGPHPQPTQTSGPAPTRHGPGSGEPGPAGSGESGGARVVRTPSPNNSPRGRDPGEPVAEPSRVPPTTTPGLAEPAARDQDSRDEPTGVANRDSSIAPLLNTVVERLPGTAAQFAAYERTGGTGAKSGRLTLARVETAISDGGIAIEEAIGDFEQNVDMIKMGEGLDDATLKVLAPKYYRRYPELETHITHCFQPHEGGQLGAAGDNGPFVEQEVRMQNGLVVRFYTTDEFHPDPTAGPREELVMTALDMLERGATRSSQSCGWRCRAMRAP